MWLFIFYLAIILTALYCLLIVLYTFFYNKLVSYKKNAGLQPKTRFTIVIPARNEVANIEKCLHSILKNQYPKELFEIIVVDDFSTDDTAHVVLQLQKQFTNLKLVQLKDHIISKQNSYKKKIL